MVAAVPTGAADRYGRRGWDERSEWDDCTGVPYYPPPVHTSHPLDCSIEVR